MSEFYEKKLYAMSHGIPKRSSIQLILSAQRYLTLVTKQELVIN